MKRPAKRATPRPARAEPLQKVDHALALAEAGFRVFPLSPNSKKPLKDFAWKESATVIPSQIRDWWAENADYNVGVATGNGILVIDADTKGGTPGLATLDLMDTVYELPTSFRVDTPSGGQHVYVRTKSPHQNRVRLQKFEGIDLRSDGGYVVGPGSVVDGRPYTAVGSPASISKLPDALDAELLRSAKKHAKAKSDQPLVELDQPAGIEQAKRYLIDRAPEAIEGAGGNNTTFSVACICRDYGLSESMTVELMLEHWNEQKASPNWTPEDLAGVVANAFTYATGGAGKAMAAAEFGLIDIDEGENPIALAREAALDVVTSTVSNSERPSRILRLYEYAEMISLPDPEWLVEGVLLKQTSALLFGKSNAFKTFLAIDIGLSVAVARHWHRHEVKQADVLFVATEGARGVMQARIPGWYDFYDIAPERRSHAAVYPQAISLDNADQVAILIATMQHRQIGLLILDIFGGTMDGKEVEDITARAWVKSNERIIRETGAATLTVAHSGYSDSSRARMHSHFWGSFGSRMLVEGNKEQRTTVLTIDRHKDSDSGQRWAFRLETTGRTLVPVLDPHATRAKPTNFSPREKIALAALEEAAAARGIIVKEAGYPEKEVVSVQIWRETALAAGITNSADAKSQHTVLNRIKKKLIDSGAIAEQDGHIWSID